MKLEVPLALGVPVISPVEVFSDRPLGSEPETMLQVYGVCPQITPTVPFGSDVVVIVNSALMVNGLPAGSPTTRCGVEDGYGGASLRCNQISRHGRCN